MSIYSISINDLLGLVLMNNDFTFHRHVKDHNEHMKK